MNTAFQRHDLVWLEPDGDLDSYAVNPAHASLVREWITEGNPLVVARQPGAETPEEPALWLGFTMAPPLTRQRVSVRVPQRMITRHTGPLGLADTLAHAPEWRETLLQLIEMCNRVGVKASVYGALSWQTLTGRTYLTGSSDIDLLFYCTEVGTARLLCNALSFLRDTGPRLDGEIISDSGRGVAWREFNAACHSGEGARVLAKSLHNVQLISTSDFFDTRQN